MVKPNCVPDPVLLAPVALLRLRSMHAGGRGGWSPMCTTLSLMWRTCAGMLPRRYSTHLPMHALQYSCTLRLRAVVTSAHVESILR